MSNIDDQNKPIDVHTHIFPGSIAAAAMEALIAQAPGIKHYSDGTRSGLIEQMNRAGVGRAVAASVATKASQTESIFNFCTSLRSDPRLIPFPSVFPSAPDVTQWLERAADMGFHGIKLHPQYQNCPFDEPYMVEVIRTGHELGLIFLVHAGDDFAFPGDKRAAPEKLARLLDKVSEAKIIAAHMGGWMVWDEVLTCLAGRPNLYLDTSMTLDYSPQETVLSLMETHGTDRVLFGTDSPWEDIPKERSRIEALGLSPDDTSKILWQNAEKLLRIHST